MAKRKLTAKLKQQIKDNPNRLRQADFSGEALEFLHRMRGVRKAIKTKEKKKYYKAPARKSEEAPEKVADLISKAARGHGLTDKQFRKKFPKEVKKLESKMVLSYSRDLELLKNDIQFLPEGKKVFNKGKRIKRDQARYLLTRFYNKMQQEAVAERMGVQNTYDGEGDLYIDIPTPDEYADLEGEELLEYIDDNYDGIDYYRSNNKKKK